MFGARTFLSLNLGEWQAVSVIVGVGVTLLVGYIQLSQARQLRDDETRPFIVVDFDFRSTLASLAVRNIGRTAARNVCVRLDGPVASTVMAQVPWAGKGLFGPGVPMFAPGREMVFALDVMSERPQSGLPMTFTGQVEYCRPHGDRTFIEPFQLDLSAFMEALMPRRGLADLADDVHELRKRVAEQLKAGPERQRP